jgi:hypothetical protein
MLFPRQSLLPSPRRPDHPRMVPNAADRDGDVTQIIGLGRGPELGNIF